MQARSTLRRSLPLVAAAALLGLAMAPIPGKWSLPDGTKIVRKPPAGSGYDLAVIQNNGPEDVLVTSKGTLVTNSVVIPPDGITVQFVLPDGAKNVVLRDNDIDGESATGFLAWAIYVPPIPPIGGGGGGSR